jgi:hypothetical protein
MIMPRGQSMHAQMMSCVLAFVHMLAIVNKFSFGSVLLLLYIVEVCMPWKWRKVCRQIAIHTDEVHISSRDLHRHNRA